MNREPIADGLFTWPDDNPALIGGRCAACDRFTFPMRTGCPYCGATAMRRHLLGRHGTLWTWTSQGFVPKAPFSGQFSDPDDFAPWFVGLIALPGQLRLESLLVDCDQDHLTIGMPMRLVITPFRTVSPGSEIVTFAFAPDSSVPAPANATEVSHA